MVSFSQNISSVSNIPNTVRENYHFFGFVSSISCVLNYVGEELCLVELCSSSPVVDVDRGVENEFFFSCLFVFFACFIVSCFCCFSLLIDNLLEHIHFLSFPLFVYKFFHKSTK